jgi:hypothetical protein
MFSDKDDRPEVIDLLRRIKEDLPALEELLTRCGPAGYEDAVYRLYHQSFKVYHLQGLTMEVVAKLRSLAPDLPPNECFEKIVSEGTGIKFERSHNDRWLEVTRPMVEAFFHARYFLEMAVKYGQELESPPACMPSGWAAVLYLYGLR